jgi:hypothetical protein
MVSVTEDAEQQRGMVIRTKQLLASLAFVLFSKATIAVKLGERNGFSVVEYVLFDFMKNVLNSKAIYFFCNGCKELRL